MNWMKIDGDYLTKPKYLVAMAKIGCDDYAFNAAFTTMIRIIDKHADQIDGDPHAYFPGMTLDDIDGIARLKGFAASVGFFVETPEGVTVIDYSIENGPNAKARFAGAIRTQKHRAKARYGPPDEETGPVTPVTPTVTPVTGSATKQKNRSRKEDTPEHTKRVREENPHVIEELPNDWIAAIEAVFGRNMMTNDHVAFQKWRATNTGRTMKGPDGIPVGFDTLAIAAFRVAGQNIKTAHSAKSLVKYAQTVVDGSITNGLMPGEGPNGTNGKHKATAAQDRRAAQAAREHEEPDGDVPSFVF